MKTFAAPLAIALVASVHATPVMAQRTDAESCSSCRNRLTVVGGASQYDLSGTGTTFFAGAHVDRQVRSWLIGDASLRVLRPTEQVRARSWYSVPEVQLQLQTARGVVRPYLGAGGGGFIGPQRRVTASGAVGFRYLGPGSPFGARAELRVRGIGRSFGGAAAEWALGAAYRF